MRSDLFHRPIKQTLITDFFGGVSQAEVLPPLDSNITNSGTSFQDAAPLDTDVEEEVVLEPEYLTAQIPRDSPHVNSSDTFFRVDDWVADLSEERDFVRLARTWSATLLLTALVGWVARS